MPISGDNAIPTGALYNELTATTRRAFVPMLYVQIYFATPTLFYLLGNAEKSAGGVNQITIPVQGQSMVQGQFTGYGGGFNSPQVTPAIQDASFNTAYWVVPVPLPFGETVLQSTDVVIPLLKARMNDVYSTTIQNMGSLIYTNNTSNTLLPDSFINGFDNGTNVTSYGGISRAVAANSFWKGQYYVASGALASSGFNRQRMSALLIQITDVAGGEKPALVVLNPSDFATLNNDIISVEQINISPNGNYNVSTNIRSSFPNINVSGVPVFADHFCPKGNAFFVNTKYTKMYLSEDLAFDFSGFYSLVPLNQIGQQGIMATGYDIVTAKPSANAWVTGIGGGAY